MSEHPLFTPLAIGSLTIPNRFWRSATWEGLADQEGAIKQDMIDFHVRLARGGVGLIVTGLAFVSPCGRAVPLQTGIETDERIAQLAVLTAAVHEAGGRIALQIAHAGIQARRVPGGDGPAGPSAVSLKGLRTTPREMTESDIRAVIDAHARAAARGREAGFDAVQLHAAHGYLISQFLSPFLNRREDAYGGSPDRRARMLLETYDAARAAVGADYPLMIKINGEDHVSPGLTVEESAAVVRELARRGLDAVEVSGGLPWSGRFGPIRVPVKIPEGEAYFRGAAAAIREQAGIPVALVGGIRSLETARDVLDQGHADIVSLSRPLVREPDLVARWGAGDERPAGCRSCGKCRVGLGPGLRCGADDANAPAAA